MEVPPQRPSGSSVLVLVTFDLLEGRSQEVPLRFVDLGGVFYVLAPGDPLPPWVKEATARDHARWRIGNYSYHGRAEIIADEHRLHTDILPRFENAFGAERLHRWFGPEIVAVALIPQVATAGDYHRDVEQLFDQASQDYDRFVGGNRFDRHLREVSLLLLRRVFREGDRILEVGSGTGLETLPLAREGVNVVAVDISAAMLKKLEEKAAAASLGQRITTRKMRAADLGELLHEFGPGYFDGAFSTYGAMNCEPSWRLLPPVLGELIKPRGNLVLGVWNRLCLLETTLYALRFRPMRALGRLRSLVPIGLSRFGIPVFPYTSGAIIRAFAPYFTPEGLLGVSVFVPPYDVGRRLPVNDGLLRTMKALDQRLGGFPPFNHLGDHFLLHMKRR